MNNKFDGINCKWAGNDPICPGADLCPMRCGRFGNNGHELCPEGHVCLPALKRQRDQVIRDYDALHQALLDEQHTIYNLENDVERLTRERDEARMAICKSASLSRLEWGDGYKTPEQIAKQRGWDCFNGEDQ